MQDGPTAVEKGGIKGFNYSQNPLTALGHVEQLDGFDWKTMEPLKHRPFKPKYHLTMGRQLIEPLSQKKPLTN
jgi:hypothetical protein